MQTLTIDPALPYLVPELRTVSICLIGCGGTGSHIAQSVARLAAHCRDTGGPEIVLALVDGDTVEQQNVGRQLFGAADVGKNKAQVLAARLSAVFGLAISAFPHMLKQERIAGQGYSVLVGAVDSAAGRRVIKNQLAYYNSPWNLWLDCGNHEASGQVVVGSAGDAQGMHGVLKLGMCGRLPTAPLIYPELLVDAPPRPREDCAAAMQDNAQSLMVNQMMAAIAGQYLYDLVVRRKLTTFRTVVDLSSLTMRSDAITARNLASATGLTEGQLLGLEPLEAKKKRKAKRAA